MASLNMVKLKAMVHYIVATVSESQFSKTKLHKILWFSDREAFLQLGATITGDTYIRKPRGPMSASLYTAVTELEREGALEVLLDWQGQYEKTISQPKRTARASSISRGESCV